jgi:hypothetical protein
VTDLNGDGLPDAVISEGGTYCYGNTGQGYWLVSKLPSGNWKLMTNGTGILEFLKTKGTGGWPDVSVGGPGFCFPVERWNGREYKSSSAGSTRARPASRSADRRGEPASGACGRQPLECGPHEILAAL